jgi:hypothetical protein
MDKRLLDRNLLLKPVKIYDQSHKHIGNIIDIHTEGMKIISKYYIRKNELLQLLIDIPEPDFSIHHIELTAKNVWTREFLFNRYCTGLKFKNISTKTKMDIIDNLIRKYGFSA